MRVCVRARVRVCVTKGGREGERAHERKRGAGEGACVLACDVSTLPRTRANEQLKTRITRLV